MRLARLLLEAVGVAWLSLVGAQYTLVMTMPDPPDLSHAYLPLLASTFVSGIMTRVIARRETSGARHGASAPGWASADEARG
jgi:hypothetical protein